jgi:hypothetical protein
MCGGACAEGALLPRNAILAPPRVAQGTSTLKAGPQQVPHLSEEYVETGLCLEVRFEGSGGVVFFMPGMMACVGIWE